MLKRVCVVLGVIWCQPALGQTFLDGLAYPKAQVKTLQVTPQQKVYTQIIPRPFYQTLPYYIRLSQQDDWRLVFPKAKEMQAWIAALEKSKEPPVFMLNLYNNKSKVNYNLTLGALSHTSHPQPATIITIYKMSAPFGQSRR